MMVVCMPAEILLKAMLQGLLQMLQVMLSQFLLRLWGS